MSSPRSDSPPAGGPLVSVIIPVHNGVELVVATLTSVLKQTHHNLEVLVVDDGSTDATADVVRERFDGDPRVRVISQPNRGVAAARNRGLEEARGPLVAFVDADDLWKPDKLSRQVKCIEGAGPDVAVVYTWHASIDENGVVLPPLRPKPIYRGKVLIPLVLQNFIGNASSPLMRTSAVKSVGGYSSDLFARSGGQGFEDWHLYLRLAETHDFEVVDEFLTGYRQASGSMSRQFRPFLANFQEARRDVWRRHPDLPRPLYLWSELYLLSWMVDRARAERMHIAALRLIVRAGLTVLRQDPILPLRAETRTFLRYVRELRTHKNEPTPGAFLDEKLDADPETWRKALELRTAFVTELSK